MNYRMTIDFTPPHPLEQVTMDLMAYLVTRLFKEYWQVPAVHIRIDERGPQRQPLREVRLRYTDGSARTVYVRAEDPEDAEWVAIQGEPEGTVAHAYEAADPPSGNPNA